MVLNKKQKKQLNLSRKKLQSLQQQLAGLKTQLDDPEEVRQVEQQIADEEAKIEKIQHG